MLVLALKHLDSVLFMPPNDKHSLSSLLSISDIQYVCVGA